MWIRIIDLFRKILFTNFKIYIVNFYINIIKYKIYFNFIF